MNLQTIRQQFVKLSGRYDLASTTTTEFDTDAGANFFINSGMHFLDHKYQTLKSWASYFDTLASGSWYLSVQGCYAISEVWCNNTESRWKLTKHSAQEVMEEYSSPITSLTAGAPLYYFTSSKRPASSAGVTDYTTGLATFLNYLKTADDGSYNTVVFAPPADDSYTIEIIGKFYHTDLSTNTDTNFWTIVAPETLLKAALYQLEVFYRNTEGAKDWLSAISLEGEELEKNLVEQESNEMEVQG
jgi:hypothetical protein